MSFGGSVKLTGESEYQRALKQINQNLRELSSDMKLVTASYDKNDNSLQVLTSKQQVLNKKLDEQSEKVKVLTNRFNEVNAQYGKNSTAQQELNKELENARKELSDIEKELGTSNNKYKEQAKVVKDLENKQDSYNKAVSDAKIKLNDAQAEYNKTSIAVDKLGKEIKDTENPTKELNQDLEDSSKQAKKASEGFTVFKGVVADLASKAIQSAISGLKKLGTAVVNIGKQAVESYADYEQLVGGVETLFKDSAKIVENYANNAYKTAGISANQYMEQVTSFSASLLQSLGQDTKKAAQYGDLAITDMADNANKLGTSMEMIQNAYQGFAKQNFTMLDNLKLGYGGTKKEMERLIEDANKVKKANGEMANLSIESFADMVEAIHIIQKEMGITGTTALEAEKTITGSTSSMKSAWKNLLTGIADNNQDMKKLVDNFVDSVITASKNLVPRIKTAVEGIKKLVMSIVKDVFPKLKKEIPQLRPLIEVFEWFVKNKSLVVNSIKLMVAAFAITKINQFTKSLTDTVKNLITIATTTTAATAATTANTVAQAANTTAQVAGTAATGALTAATNLLNAAWKANPIGLVITAITGAAGLLAALGLSKDKTDEATESSKKYTKAIKDQTERINDSKNSWDNLVEAQQNATNDGMSELSYYQNLYDELENIVDANGRVKKGYEERASFITSKLSEALGIEIENVDGVIQGYDNLKKSIDDVMKKKKAQIILDSQETLYKEAINGQTEALKELVIAEDNLNAKKAEQADLQGQLNEINDTYQMYLEKYPWLASEYYNSQYKQISSLEKKIEKSNEEVATAQENYNKQQGIIESYAYNIGVYENNMALAHAEKYDEMTTVTWDLVKEYQNAEEAQKAMQEDNIKRQELWLETLKGMRNESNKDIIDSQIKTAEKELENQKNSLKQYEKATKEGLNAVEIAWSDSLDEQLSDITGANIEFKDAGNDNVQMYVDGVISGKPTSKKEMANLITETIKEITNRDDDAKKAGEDLIEGVNNGVKNQNKQNGVFKSIANFGSNLLQKLKDSLKEKSPSKATNEMGQFLLEGLGIGIDKEENSIYKQVSSFGKNVLSTLNGSLAQGVGFPTISTGNLKATNVNNSYAETQSLNMVAAFKQALEEMKIELDDENVGKFVDKKVTKLIYT